MFKSFMLAVVFVIVVTVHGFASHQAVVRTYNNLAISRRSINLSAAKRFYGISKPIDKTIQAPTLVKVQETRRETVAFPMKILGMIIAVCTIVQKIVTKHISSLIEALSQVWYYIHTASLLYFWFTCRPTLWLIAFAFITGCAKEHYNNVLQHHSSIKKTSRQERRSRGKAASSCSIF